MKSKSFVEYGKLPRIQSRWMSKGIIKDIDRKGRILNSIRKPRAYSEINRQFEIERSNKILLDKLIHIANRKKEFGWSDGLNGKRAKGEIAGSFSVKKMFQGRLESGKEESAKEEVGSVGKRKLFLKGNLKSNLPSLIYKKVNKEKGELAKMKVRPMKKIITDFTLEDDSSIEES